MADQASDDRRIHRDYRYRDRYHAAAVARLARGDDPGVVIHTLRNQYRRLDEIVALQKREPQ